MPVSVASGTTLALGHWGHFTFLPASCDLAALCCHSRPSPYRVADEDHAPEAPDLDDGRLIPNYPECAQHFPLPVWHFPAKSEADVEVPDEADYLFSRGRTHR